MKSEIFTAWVTKHALTTGIEMVKAELRNDISERMIRYAADGGLMVSTAHGNDWHRTPEAAIARAEEMRTARIKSLQKQIVNLERMVFRRH